MDTFTRLMICWSGEQSVGAEICPAQILEAIWVFSIKEDPKPDQYVDEVIGLTFLDFANVLVSNDYPPFPALIDSKLLQRL